MKLAKWAFLVTLTMLAMMISVPAQTLRSEKDPRNIAPTVGTGGPVGGPTGLFTVYDGQTLRKGEWTLSLAYSNFDRDPGNADFVEVPVSFQIGLSDYLELFFNTDMYRGVKVNSPRHLSGFYLPNSQFRFGSALQTAPAIVMAPQGSGTSQYPGWAVFRPQGNQTFTPFPYVGGNAGTYNLLPPFYSGPIFGFPSPTTGNALLGPPRAGGNGADNFPGIGSVYGSILPGIVLQTVTLTNQAGAAAGTAPTVFTIAPTYLPDAPFINRGYGESAFSTFSAGAKWRWTGPTNPIGAGIIAYYQWYADKGNDITGFNQMQRGASPGGNNGDIGVVFFTDARVRKWMNVSANIGYKYTSKVKGDFPGGSFTMLDRGDELMASFAVDFPVNKYFQPIAEFRTLQYVGGRTPNAFENSPVEGLVGARWFPYRWMSLGMAYRHHFNQQDRDSFDTDFTGNVNVVGRVPSVISTSFRGVPAGFTPSSDPHGFIFQFTAGRRNKLQGDIPRPVANVTGVSLNNKKIVIPCKPGYKPREGTSCPDGTNISVGTSVENPGNEVLTYQHTVSAGRIVGQGANVTWDLSGVRPGTYTITSAVDNGCGYCGKTVTETIEVVECDCVPECSCATISVSDGGVVRPGDEMNFVATAGGGSGDLSYNWTVSNGTIVGGQGTPAIRVATTREMEGQNITATVEISGSNLCASCQKTASNNGSVAGIIKPFIIDEFGKLPDDEVKARVDALYITLGNNPNAQGYIINYGTDKEVAAREKQIQKAITFRKYDSSRVTIVRGGANPNGAGVWTKFWIVPPGADNPNP
ncbi:MAG: hypothetical protein IPK58_17450 [Acidobacteria bacterium]|nr:hypothetical protein [Acidobacteriota bacterium]